MHKRWIRRSLLIIIFTFFIILYVDFQLRTSSLPKPSVGLHPSTGAHQRSIQQVAPPIVNSSSSSRRRSGGGGNLHMVKKRYRASDIARVTQAKLKLEDVFIAVKTTGKFHKSRLALLLETWISRTKAHVSISFFHLIFTLPLPHNTSTCCFHIKTLVAV